MFLRCFNKRVLLKAGSPVSTCLRTSALRTYSSQKNQSKKDDLPSFTKIALVGVVGTIIFVETVKSLDKNKPKNSYSESEFETEMQGVKRRKMMFQPGQLHIELVTSGVSRSVLEKQRPLSKIVDVGEAVEYYRHLQDDKYYALLNEIHESHGASYPEHLPKGLQVMLVARYLKENCQEGDSVVVTNFPLKIQDAIKFENEVSLVDRVIFTESSVGTELGQYYQTVNKVEILK
ncbi:LAME_0E05226g1_1 [Lachancea meyersii CBS 8951]|uniref:LAME_0E05226g1_1 n=1 Tax=Lachancea meyersii CBS 8951 TaxID=1266667 RepID=A0A1G4JH65_9SACH|nr:LAME_0E05226g1_1 [Lachancea meyersii CBS 8951]